jgi:hypothetical protein
MMNLAANCEHHDITEEGCDRCGFMKKSFRESEEGCRNASEIRGISEREGSNCGKFRCWISTLFWIYV